MEQKTIETLTKEARREYYRKWRSANKDKEKQYRDRYWEKRAMKKMQADKMNEEENKET